MNDEQKALYKEIEKYVYVIIVKLCIFRTFQHLIV